MKHKVLTMQSVVTNVLKHASIIIMILAIAVLSYLSFIDNIKITPDIRKITLMALAAMILNFLVWETFYNNNYEKIIGDDLNNKTYCIHKRYYIARKGITHTQLQEYVRLYNKNLRESWEKEIEDITDRSIEEIRKGKYRHNTYKFLIFRIKHKIYPKSGIKSANQLLRVLRIGNNYTKKHHLHKAENMHRVGRVRKLLYSLIGMSYITSITYSFIQNDMRTAFVTLLIQITMLFVSALTGSISGISGAKTKLGIAEEVSELLEEWRGIQPTELPYSNNKDFDDIINEVDNVENKGNKLQIKIT